MTFKDEFDRVIKHFRSAVFTKDASGIDAAKHNPSMWRGFLSGLGFAITVMPLISRGHVGIEAVFVRLEELALLNNDMLAADRIRSEKFRILTGMGVGEELVTGSAENRPFPFVIVGKDGPPEV